MPFSQIIPPSPSSTESKSLFYTSVSLLLSRIQGYNSELMLLNCGVGEDLRVFLDCKEIQPSILKEISPGISLEGMMLKLKLQYFGFLMQKS